MIAMDRTGLLLNRGGARATSGIKAEQDARYVPYPTLPLGRDQVLSAPASPKEGPDIQTNLIRSGAMGPLTGEGGQQRMREVKRLAFAIGVMMSTLIAPATWATVKPHGLFTDGAVLQQGMPVPVWGTAADGERVTVTFQDQSVSTTARDGRWKLRLPSLKPGGPFTMRIAGENTVELRDVLVGEVYVCSGQSNMEWPVSLTTDAPKTIAQATDPMLRLFTVPKNVSNTPVSDVSGPWKACDPESVTGFSAVAYFFGRDLRRALKVPVGLIHTSWGGTPAEAWTSRATLESDSSLREILDRYARALDAYPAALKTYQTALGEHVQAVETARREGRGLPELPQPPGNPENFVRPTGLYNAMIHPLLPYAIRGAIWYQGESNAGRAYQYQELFSAMIRNWRQDWGQGDFPFLFVQLAPFMKIETQPKESAWAELREAQRLTSLAVPHTAMAVITDVGDAFDIHPREKQTVGERLARAARAMVYGERITPTGPMFERMEVRGDEAVLQFRHVGRGLVARGGELTGFTIAGADRKWAPARAVIRGDRVIVSSPQVERPVAVRYGWANYPVTNLYNREGLPASPFRTDDFPLSTLPSPPPGEARR
jgi:sialate O-acetylesterase